LTAWHCIFSAELTKTHSFNENGKWNEKLKRHVINFFIVGKLGYGYFILPSDV